MYIESVEGKKWLKEITAIEYFERIVRLDVLLFRYAELILEKVEQEYDYSKKQDEVDDFVVSYIQTAMPKNRQKEFEEAIRGKCWDRELLNLALPCLGINYLIRSKDNLRPSARKRHPELCKWKRVKPSSSHPYIEKAAAKVSELHDEFVTVEGQDAFFVRQSGIEELLDIIENPKQIEKCEQCISWGETFYHLIEESECLPNSSQVKCLQYYLSAKSSNLLSVLYTIFYGEYAGYQIDPNSKALQGFKNVEESFVYKESVVALDEKMAHVKEKCGTERKMNFISEGLLLTHIAYLDWEDDLRKGNKLKRELFRNWMAQQLEQELVGMVDKWRTKYQVFNLEECKKETGRLLVSDKEFNMLAFSLEDKYLNKKNLLSFSSRKKEIAKMRKELLKALSIIKKYSARESGTEEGQLSIYKAFVTPVMRTMFLETEDEILQRTGKSAKDKNKD